MASRIKELESLIRYHNNLYYNNEPEISDAEWDALQAELKELDPKNALFEKEVGVDSAEGFKKEKHLMPMGSQQKAGDEADFRKWAAKDGLPEKADSTSKTPYIAQFKLDGASLELQYVEGFLVKAVTRGDGEKGDLITENIFKMKSALKTLRVPFTGAIRGEVLMGHDTHAKYYSDKANCRNAAVGVMKRKDGVGSEHLFVMVYDAVSTNGKDYWADEWTKQTWLQNQGFRVASFVQAYDVQCVIETRKLVMDSRKDLNFDIDGIVIKRNTIDLEDMKRARPDHQIAFKFELEEAESTLIDIEWSISGKTYTPVGIVNPVRLNGTTVQRASLANPNLIKELDLKIGSKVVVVKRGEIIPKIIRKADSDIGAGSAVPFPDKCEVCGAPLVNAGTELYCPNHDCSKVKIHRIEKWVKKVDIYELGGATIKALFDAGVIQNPSDLYKMKESDISPITGGTRSAEKIVASVNSRKEIDLAVFIGGLDFDGFGETLTATIMDAGYNTLEKLQSVTLPELAAIKGIGEITARILKTGIKEADQEIKDLLAVGIKIKKPEAIMANGKLEGKSFCFTGALETMKRAEAEALVKSLGGSVKAVSKGLTYLVTNDPESGSAKNVKAQALGVELIDERGFLGLTK
jgi:DNA ligase (NAD+)